MAADERGFSLVELLLGAVVAMVALGAVISVCLQSGRVRHADEQLNLAYIACSGNLEELRGMPFADLPTMDGVGFDVPGLNFEPSGLQPLPGDSDGLPGEFSVTVDQSGGGVTLYRVVAEVQWVGAKTRPGSPWSKW